MSARPALARRSLDAATAGLNLAGSLMILALMLLIGADVIGRAAFGAPISGVPEIVTLSIVAIVFLQIPQAARMGRLTRSEAFLGWLAARSRRGAAAVVIMFDLVALAVIGAILEASWPLFVKSWERDSFVGAIGDFTAPVWPVKAIILIGCAMLMLRFLVRILDGIAELRGGGEEGGPGSGAGAPRAGGSGAPEPARGGATRTASEAATAGMRATTPPRPTQAAPGATPAAGAVPGSTRDLHAEASGGPRTRPSASPPEPRP